MDLAKSGKEAISALASRDYDLVFMDHMMPEMDGVETTQVIRTMKGKDKNSLPIVALTANAISGVKDMFIESGMNDFLSRPTNFDDMKRVMINWLPKEEKALKRK